MTAGSKTPPPSRPRPFTSTSTARSSRAASNPRSPPSPSYLKANAGKAVRVEGNCDERGTEEYNRSLGERRALAAREELVRLGIEPTRVDTKTWGKDNPANDPGHDESAWKKNRRDEFIVLSPPK